MKWLGQARLMPPEPPIRAEIFSVERLERLAEGLAVGQHVASNPKHSFRLAARLRDNARVLAQCHLAVVRAGSAGRAISPAAEWLRDNFHVVDEQIREITANLPPGYYRRLPKLADGPLQGHSRIYGVAWALVAHTDSAFDVEKLKRFVDAYQRVQPQTVDLTQDMIRGYYSFEPTPACTSIVLPLFPHHDRSSQSSRSGNSRVEIGLRRIFSTVPNDYGQTRRTCTKITLTDL